MPPLARMIPAAALALLEHAIDREAEEFEEITIPVASTAIRSISWRTGDVITVEFHRRGTYSYDGSKELFMAFVSAPSKGRFFNDNFQVRR